MKIKHRCDLVCKVSSKMRLSHRTRDVSKVLEDCFSKIIINENTEIETEKILYSSFVRQLTRL